MPIISGIEAIWNTLIPFFDLQGPTPTIVGVRPAAVGLVLAFFVASEVVTRLKGIILAPKGRFTVPLKCIGRGDTVNRGGVLFACSGGPRLDGRRRRTVDQVATRRTTQTSTADQRTTRIQSKPAHEQEERGHDAVTPASILLLLPIVVVVRAGRGRRRGDTGNDSLMIIPLIRDGNVPQGRLLLEKIHGAPSSLIVIGCLVFCLWCVFQEITQTVPYFRTIRTSWCGVVM